MNRALRTTPLLVLFLAFLPFPAAATHNNIAPTACYRFDERSATTVVDACDSLNGTYTNGPTLANTGVFGFAANFDGTNDRVDFADSAIFKATAAWSVDGWVNPDTIGTTQVLVDKANGNNGMTVRIIIAGNIEFRWGTGSATVVSTSTTILTAAKWTHFAGTWDGSNIRLYINGVLEDTDAAAAAGSDTSIPRFAATNDGTPGSFLDGTLDNIRVWDELTLTSAQVLDLYREHEYAGTSEYQVWMLQANPTTGAVASTTVNVPKAPYANRGITRFSTWEISATYTVVAPVAGTSTATFQFLEDAATLTGCSWDVSSAAATVTGMRVAHNFLIRCASLKVIRSGSHTVEITVAGTNPVVLSRVDIMLIQTDEIYEDTVPRLEGAVSFQADQTNDLSNKTLNHVDYNQAQENVTQARVASVHSKLNETFGDLDHHAHQILSSLNQTRSLVNQSYANLTAFISGNGNFTCSNCSLEPQTIIDLPGLTDAEVGALILFLGFLIFSVWRGLWFVAVASTMGLSNLFLQPHPFEFVFLFLLLILAFWLDALRDWLAKRSDAGGDEDAG